MERIAIFWIDCGLPANARKLAHYTYTFHVHVRVLVQRLVRCRVPGTGYRDRRSPTYLIYRMDSSDVRANGVGGHVIGSGLTLRRTEVSAMSVVCHCELSMVAKY